MSVEEDFCDACFRGDLREAARLIENGVDLAWRNQWGWSLLHFAVEHGHPELIRELARAGARQDLAGNAHLNLPLLVATHGTGR